MPTPKQIYEMREAQKSLACLMMNFIVGTFQENQLQKEIINHEKLWKDLQEK